MRRPSLAYVIVWFVGVLMAGISGGATWHFRQLRELGRVATATVVDHFHGSGTRDAPIVTYVVNGVTYRYEHPTTTRGGAQAYPLGSTVDVLYLPSDPNTASLKRVVDESRIEFVFGFSVLAFLVVPTALYLVTARRQAAS